MLSEKVGQVNVVHSFENEDYRPVPKNVIVYNPFKNFKYERKNLTEGIRFLLKNINKNFLRDFSYQINAHDRILQKSERIKRMIIDNSWENHIHYIYWFDEWATILARVKKDLPQLKIVARAHGFDLQKSRTRLGYFPYRNEQLAAVSRLFAVSEQGSEYLKSNYPKFSNRIQSLFLGTNALQLNSKVPEEIHLLSISNLIPLKRVELIANALMNVRIPVKWTHFGDGPLRNQIEGKTRELREHIQVEFKGHVSNEKLMEFIEGEPISCLIHVSESEGLPLSMMEVQSAGIPIIATDVGGVGEIVNNQTGVLLPAQIDQDRLVSEIESFKKHPLNRIEARQSIRENWQNNFDAINNFEIFASYLQTLN
ncbi:MAG: glycosyltransferase [Bacteroidota bacterium]